MRTVLPTTLMWFCLMHSAIAGVAENQDPLSISIALPESPFNSEIYVDILPTCQFHVVMTNTSDKSINVIMENSSWGYSALMFELQDEGGNKYVLKRNPIAWKDNGLAYWTLKPKEYYVIDVCLGEPGKQGNRESWSGFPDLANHGGTRKVKMKAIFEFNIEKHLQNVLLWHGRIESQTITCRIRDIRK